MSLFQTAATWLLRAIVVWLLVEAGLGAYEEGARQQAAYARISGTSVVLTRLANDAAAIQARAHERETVAAAAVGDPWRLAHDANAATILREHLMALGAQAPVVEEAEPAIAERRTEIRLKARWREHAEASPNVLHGLVGRISGLRIANLSLSRIDNGLVAAEAEFVAIVRYDAPAPP